jgi:hypothetical protein
VAVNSVQYTLTADTGDTGSGGVTLDPDGGVYPDGTVVTLTVSPDAGSRFTGRSGDLVATSNSEALAMDGDKTVTAMFDAGNSGDLNGDGMVNLKKPGTSMH